MHLPDGFLDTKTALLSTGAAAVGLGLALQQTRAALEPRKIPLLGLSAAFVFAAQMLNFPVAGGTSGHLIGGTLIAVLLGPAAGVVVMTCVLIIQCLMFADGGLLALGANAFNMAIVNVCGGYLVFRGARRILGRNDQRATVGAAAFAAWCATVLSALCCAGQLALSGMAPWGLAFPAMVNIHMVIGLGEGLATALVVLAVLKARPELVTGHHVGGTLGWRVSTAYLLLVLLGLTLFVAPFASSLPDGLEAVARQLGFEQRAANGFNAPMADYQAPFAGSAIAATAVAGFVGTLVAFFAAYGLARALVPPLGSVDENAN